MRVAVGQHVAGGQVLATEDTQGSAAALASAEASLTAAEAQVQVAESNLAQTRAKIASQSSTSTQVSAAKAQLAADQAQLVVDQQRLSAAQTAYAASPTAQNALAVAQAQQAVARDQSAIATDKTNLASAQNSSLTSSANDAQLAQAQAQVTQANNQVSTAAASVSTAKTAVTATAISAPVDGVVTAVNLTVGQAPSASAISLRSDNLAVVIAVAEQDVPNLAVGQTANITLTALNQTVQTKVRGLPTQASSSSGSSTVTFPLVLTLPGNPKGLLPGMSASVSIATATATNVLRVPTTAIQGTTGSNTVQVMSAGLPVSTPVNIGLSTNTYTEIISGLQQGQTVVTGVVNAATGTASSSTSRGGFGGAGIGGLGGGGVRPGG